MTFSSVWEVAGLELPLIPSFLSSLIRRQITTTTTTTHLDIHMCGRKVVHVYWRYILISSLLSNEKFDREYQSQSILSRVWVRLSEKYQSSNHHHHHQQRSLIIPDVLCSALVSWSVRQRPSTGLGRTGDQHWTLNIFLSPNRKYYIDNYTCN